MDQGPKAHGVTEQERLSRFAKIPTKGRATGASEVEAVVKVSRTAHKI